MSVLAQVYPGVDKFTLNSKSLRLVMPHRHSMALLDGVRECTISEKKVTGFKNVSSNDPSLQGHFPDWPFFPPALLIESMAQAAGCLMNILYLLEKGITVEQICDPECLAEAPLPGLSVLAESRVRQFDVAFPGDTISLEARVMMRHSDLSAFNVRAHVDGRELAAGEMILGYPPYVPSLHDVGKIKDKG